MILLTGADGFIGSYLAKMLPVITTDHANTQHNGDLTDPEFVASLPDVDTVIHLAAFNSTANFYTTPYDVTASIVKPTMNLLDRYPDAHFVYAGTSEAYAGGVNLGIVPVPTAETVPLVIDDITNLRWSYAAAKIAMESAVIGHSAQFGHTYNIMRFHNIYGKHQQLHFIPEFVNRVMAGDHRVFGHDERRSFCHIDDAIDIITKVYSLQNEIFHIGSNVDISIYQAAHLICDHLGADRSLLTREAGMAGSVNHRAPDLTKLLSVIGEYEFTTFKDGIGKTLS
jgi:nucleoside-diphosphate-sugar epimerase